MSCSTRYNSKNSHECLLWRSYDSVAAFEWCCVTLGNTLVTAMNTSCCDSSGILLRDLRYSFSSLVLLLYSLVLLVLLFRLCYPAYFLKIWDALWNSQWRKTTVVLAVWATNPFTDGGRSLSVKSKCRSKSSNPAGWHIVSPIKQTAPSWLLLLASSPGKKARLLRDTGVHRDVHNVITSSDWK